MKQVESVGLLLVNPQGLLYCVRELQARPEYGKIPGSKDFSFPWETKEPRERTLRTLHRLIVEEIDMTDEVQISFPIAIGSVPVHETVAHIYLAKFEAGIEPMCGAHAGIEIDPLGWQTREFLLSRCRDGVPEVLKLWDKYEEELKACQA